ncbi:hypothetical protein [Arthrobacter sp. UM1]|uniref:hypothetical protein n=1 Tax=Arthrobacter sp. UM1 TaxID=2766776 RepID=UPI001CF67BD9|nr:hypothetical protein [Arthrobacter sp. UM1]MCB4209104.1 hypothetical protein [Arthrobacter sp. UM1]
MPELLRVLEAGEAGGAAFFGAAETAEWKEAARSARQRCHALDTGAWRSPAARELFQRVHEQAWELRGLELDIEAVEGAAHALAVAQIREEAGRGRSGEGGAPWAGVWP